MNHYAYEQGFKQRYAQLEKQAMDPRLAYGLGGALGGGALGFFTAPEGHGLRNALIGAGLGGAAGAGVGQYMMPGESPEKALAGINAPLPAGAVKIPEHPYKVKPLPPIPTTATPSRYSPEANLPDMFTPQSGWQEKVIAGALPFPLNLAGGFGASLGRVRADLARMHDPGYWAARRAEVERRADEPAYRAALAAGKARK